MSNFVTFRMEKYMGLEGYLKWKDLSEKSLENMPNVKFFAGLMKSNFGKSKSIEELL